MNRKISLFIRCCSSNLLCFTTIWTAFSQSVMDLFSTASNDCFDECKLTKKLIFTFRIIVTYGLCLTFATSSFAQSIGQAIYENPTNNPNYNSGSFTCSNCHSQGIGPQLGVSSNWLPRFQGLGVNGLANSVRGGTDNGMPAYPNIPTNDAMAVVEYILAQSGVDTAPVPPPGSTDFPPNITGRTPSGTLSLIHI